MACRQRRRRRRQVRGGCRRDPAAVAAIIVARGASRRLVRALVRVPQFLRVAGRSRVAFASASSPSLASDGAFVSRSGDAPFVPDGSSPAADVPLASAANDVPRSPSRGRAPPSLCRGPLRRDDIGEPPVEAPHAAPLALRRPELGTPLRRAASGAPPLRPIVAGLRGRLAWVASMVTDDGVPRTVDESWTRLEGLPQAGHVHCIRRVQPRV